MPPGPALSFAAGDTFLMLGPSSEKLHLYIALCGQTGDPPIFIAVPLNTATLLTDRTVLLQPGDHPFVTRETSVSYDLLHQFDVEKLLQLERLSSASQQTLFERRQRVRTEVLQRLVDGARVSDLAPKKMARVLETLLAADDPSP